MSDRLIPPPGCSCASFWTVRQQHKPDCACWPAVGQSVRHVGYGRVEVTSKGRYGNGADSAHVIDLNGDHAWVPVSDLRPLVSDALDADTPPCSDHDFRVAEEFPDGRVLHACANCPAEVMHEADGAVVPVGEAGS